MTKNKSSTQDDPVFAEGLRQLYNKEAPFLKPLPEFLLKKKLPPFFRTSLKTSLVVHLTLIALFWGGSALMSLWGDSFFETKKQYPLSSKAMRSAIRVDLVDLPKLKLDELSKVDLTQDIKKQDSPEAEPLKPVELPKDAMVLKTSKKIPEDAKHSDNRRLNEIQDRLRADRKRAELISKLKNANIDSAPGREALGGNQISEGYSVTGDVATDLDVYNGKAEAHIRKNWNVPSWMGASKLRARVIIKITPTGRIVEKIFTSLSGNQAFDKSIDQAIVAADPFPPPPDSLKKRFMEDGIELGFPE